MPDELWLGWLLAEQARGPWFKALFASSGTKRGEKYLKLDILKLLFFQDTRRDVKIAKAALAIKNIKQCNRLHFSSVAVLKSALNVNGKCQIASIGDTVSLNSD